MNTELNPATADAGPSPGEDLNVTLVATVGIVAAIALFVLIVGIQAWFFAYRADEQEQKMVPNMALVELVNQQNAQLEGINLNRDDQLRTPRVPGVVPIDVAMAQVVQRYAAVTPGQIEKR